MKVKYFATAILNMKMMSVGEFDKIVNHNCAEYVAKGKTFKYNKMDGLKEMRLNEQGQETPISDPSVSANIASVDNTLQGMENVSTNDRVPPSSPTAQDNADTATMNTEGDASSSVNQSIQGELPNLTSSGTMTDVGSSTLGTQTTNPNMIANGVQATNPGMATIGV